jgi:hypothetical protein
MALEGVLRRGDGISAFAAAFKLSDSRCFSSLQLAVAQGE